MTLFAKCKTHMLASGFAAAGLIAGGVQQAEATTVATAFVNGSYNIETPPTTLTVPPGTDSAFVVNGSFGGSLLAPFTPGPQAYRFSAHFSLNGSDIVSGSFTAELTPSDFSGALNVISPIVQFVGSNAGSYTLPLGLGTAGYGFSNVTAGPVSFSGNYDIEAFLTVPIGPLVDSGLLEVVDLLGLSPAVLGSFSFPNNDSGNFNLNLAIAAVPVPASLPLLGAGMFLLLGLRRRRQSA